MTPKERVKSAMDLQFPDKIPLMCQFSFGHMLLQLNISPVEFWFDKSAFAEGLIKLRNIYDFDGILISLHGHNPAWKDLILSYENNDGKEVAKLHNGDKIIFPGDDLPQYVFSKRKSLPVLNEISIDDLPVTLDYIPVSRDLHFQISLSNKFDVIYDIVEKAGGNYSIHGEITSPFDYLLDLLGNQEALMGLIENPDKCKMILAQYTKLIKELALEMCETGVDAIKVSSPFAGSGFISPYDYEEFVVPFEAEIAKAVRNKDVHIYTHTCGSIDDRLEIMLDAGVSGIECLDPPPLGNVELSDAVERIKNKGFIKGNIDSVNSLLNASKEDIVEDAKNRIQTGKQSPGFILSTACSIAPAVKKENILLLRETVNKWG